LEEQTGCYSWWSNYGGAHGDGGYGVISGRADGRDLIGTGSVQHRLHAGGVAAAFAGDSFNGAWTICHFFAFTQGCTTPDMI
jgi:hypothetical protein